MCICESDRALKDIKTLTPEELQIVRHILALALSTLVAPNDMPISWGTAQERAQEFIETGRCVGYTASVTFEHFGHFATAEAWVTSNEADSARRRTSIPRELLSKTLELAILTSPEMKVRFIGRPD